MVDQFDRLIKRKAFLDQYKKEKWFSDGLGEFDEARYVPQMFRFSPPFHSGILAFASGDVTDKLVLTCYYP